MAKAKFDIKLEAAKGLYAGAGVADLAVEAVKDYVADVQKKVTATVADVQKTVSTIDFEPKSLGKQASTLVNARVEALTAEGRARRAAVEAMVAELQGDAKELPTKVQSALLENVATATTTYATLAKRGELVVRRLRRDAAEGVTPSGPPTVPPVKPTADKPAPAKKVTAKQSPAKKTAAKKAPAKKASAPKTTS